MVVRLEVAINPTLCKKVSTAGLRWETYLRLWRPRASSRRSQEVLLGSSGEKAVSFTAMMTRSRHQGGHRNKTDAMGGIQHLELGLLPIITDSNTCSL